MQWLVVREVRAGRHSTVRTCAFPALPGCLSQGNTHDEALVNLKEAIAGWLEVMEAKQTFDPTRTVEVVV